MTEHEDMEAQRQALLAEPAPQPRTLSRASTYTVIIVGVIGLLIGAVGFTVGYTNTRNQAEAGVDLAEQVEELCATASANPEGDPNNTDSLCSDAQNVIEGAPGQQGDAGQEGPPGTQGPQGPQGVQGFQGPKGDPGLVGGLGPRGPPGAEGIGTDGQPGSDGEDGDAGAQGPQGPQGEKGEKGEPGEKGEKGEKGDKGDEGQSAFPFTFVFVIPDIMGDRTYTVECTGPGACSVTQS